MLDGQLRRNLDQQLARGAASVAAHVAGEDVACDGEQPRIDGSGRLIGVPCPVHGEERLLIEVVHVVEVARSVRAQKAHERWADVVQQRAIRFAVAALRRRHPRDAPPAARIAPARRLWGRSAHGVTPRAGSTMGPAPAPSQDRSRDALTRRPGGR